jgi:hypothetical protein
VEWGRRNSCRFSHWLQGAADLLDSDVHASQGGVRLFAVAGDLPSPLLTEVRTRDYHLVDAMTPDDLAQHAACAEHAQSVNQLALLEVVIIDETDRGTPERVVVRQLAQQQVTRVPGPVDQHAPLAADGRNRQQLA